MYADQRAAWEGPYTARAFPVRVEAAWYRGRPVYFDIVAPWARPQRAQPFEFSRRQVVGAHIGLVILLAVAAVAGLLARRHLQMGRGDRRGATRVAAFAFLAGFASWVLEADHAPELAGELFLILRGMAWRLLLAAFMWVLYVALEPFVRRRWPRTLVSWTRLLAGRIRDPLVGRDVLVGAAGGALSALIFYTTDSLPRWLGTLPATPWFWVPLDPLLGIGFTMSALLEKLIGSVMVALALLLLLLLFRTVLRREWLAAAVLVLLTSTQALFFSEAPWWIVAPGAILLRVIPIVLTIRFGLLACVSSFVVVTMLCEMPIASDLTSWAGLPATAALATVAALTLYAFRIATGGRGLAFELGD
jgi:serine/threonine-protein kinase